MRSCFIDHNQEANYDLLKRHGITEILYPTRDSPVNSNLCQKAKDKGFNVGLMVAWNWLGGHPTGARFAEFCDNELKRIAWPGNPKLVADIEKGAGLDDLRYVDYVVDFCRRWRELRPKRATDWTLESMQGGLFNGRGQAVNAIIAANVGIIPQYYTGDERPMAQDVAFRDLTAYGFPSHRIRGFYLAKDLPINWDGYAWTQGKLPA